MKKGLQNLLLLTGTGIVLFGAWRVLARGKGGGPVGPVVPDACRSVVLLGDSTVGGARLRSELESLLGPCSTVETASYQGKETGYVLGRAGTALAGHPTDLVALCGVNDIWHGKSADVVIKNLEAIYAVGKGAGARVIAVQILPWAGYQGGISEKQATTTQAVNDYIRFSSSADSVVLTEGLGDGEGRLHPDFHDDSGLHLNPLGQEAFAETIARQAF